MQLQFSQVGAGDLLELAQFEGGDGLSTTAVVRGAAIFDFNEGEFVMDGVEGDQVDFTSAGGEVARQNTVVLLEEKLGSDGFGAEADLEIRQPSLRFGKDFFL